MGGTAAGRALESANEVKTAGKTAFTRDGIKLQVGAGQEFLGTFDADAGELVDHGKPQMALEGLLQMADRDADLSGDVGYGQLGLKAITDDAQRAGWRRGRGWRSCRWSSGG